MSTLKALTTLLAKPHRLKALLSYGHKGYLATIGWFRSFDSQLAQDESGNPLPWVTYSFIDFIKDRLNKNQEVFEFGSGSSTLFYAKRVGTVISVEHDKDWYMKINDNKPANSELILKPLEPDGAYSKTALQLNRQFDIIIVDGRDRVNCCKHSVQALTDSGVLVLDDSERPEYEQARIELKQAGFKELSFSGISPGLFYNKATSVFYKENNCLNI